jgi:Ca2+-binding RTX toxin-like protein
VNVAGKTFLFAVERGVSGIASYWMQSGDSFSTKTSYPGTGIDYFDDVSAFASVTIGGQTYLFTASAIDAGINSFSIDQNGALQLTDSVDPGDGFGFSLPQALETLSVAGQNYLIMASAGTSSITVYAVGADGSLTETDHLIDGVGTRFEDASVLATFTYEGRSYILAAGSDDGLTLLELSTSGTLSVIGVLADGFDTTLNNITDIEVVTIGTEIHAIISSDTENGFTQIEIDLADTGVNIIGDQSHEVLNGTTLNDTLSGMAGSDKFFAGDGNDLLIDGEGRDHFFGGAGADVFQFVEDNTLDLIRDYEAGIDIIDLSLITGVTDIGNLTIETRSFGAIITVGGEEIRIETSDGTALTASDFTVDDFIF